MNRRETVCGWFLSFFVFADVDRKWARIKALNYGAIQCNIHLTNAHAHKCVYISVFKLHEIVWLTVLMSFFFSFRLCSPGWSPHQNRSIVNKLRGFLLLFVSFFFTSVLSKECNINCILHTATTQKGISKDGSGSNRHNRQRSFFYKCQIILWHNIEWIEPVND